jgi:hypothetical protein
MPSDFSELVCRVGGAMQAARLLGTTSKNVADWERSDRAPQWALRLLWYAGPDGRAAALLDTENELRAVVAERDALASESKRRAALLDERRAALAAQVKALEYENSELRRLANTTVIAADLEAVRSIADRLLRTLGRGEVSVRQ